MFKQPYLKEYHYKNCTTYSVYEFNKDLNVWSYNVYFNRKDAYKALKTATEVYLYNERDDIIMYSPDKHFYRKKEFVNYETYMVFVALIITVLLIIFT